MKQDKASFPTCTEAALTDSGTIFKQGVPNIFTMKHQNTKYNYTPLGKQLNNTEINSMTLNVSNPDLILDYILLMVERL